MSKDYNLPESPAESEVQDELIGGLLDGSDMTQEEAKEILFEAVERTDLNTP